MKPSDAPVDQKKQTATTSCAGGGRGHGEVHVGARREQLRDDLGVTLEAGDA